MIGFVICGIARYSCSASQAGHTDRESFRNPDPFHIQRNNLPLYRGQSYTEFIIEITMPNNYLCERVSKATFPSLYPGFEDRQGGFNIAPVRVTLFVESCVPPRVLFLFCRFIISNPLYGSLPPLWQSMHIQSYICANKRQN